MNQAVHADAKRREQGRPPTGEGVARDERHEAA